MKQLDHAVAGHRDEPARPDFRGGPVVRKGVLCS